jgi:hypothetical protein
MAIPSCVVTMDDPTSEVVACARSRDTPRPAATAVYDSFRRMVQPVEKSGAMVFTVADLGLDAQI